jgi:hypothetical protein
MRSQSVTMAMASIVMVGAAVRHQRNWSRQPCCTPSGKVLASARPRTLANVVAGSTCR